MNKMRLLIPAAIVASTFASLSFAQSTNGAGATPGHPGHSHFRHRAPFARILHKLNLSAQQKSQVKNLVAQARSERASQRDSMRTNRAALEATSPNDPSYAGLVSTAQANASAAVQARADLWAQIYGVLTPEQKSQIPGIAAADQARRAQWQAAHGNS